jgi:hypothetical protein
VGVLLFILVMASFLEGNSDILTVLYYLCGMIVYFTCFFIYSYCIRRTALTHFSNLILKQ